MPLKKPTQVNLSTQIVNEMETCIKDGIWPVGTKIPSELELMKEFDVSRNTIREAILSLVHAGMLKSQRGKGTYVLCDSRLGAVTQDYFQNADLAEVLETRRVLESAIVRYACARVTAEDVVALRASYQKRSDTPVSATEDFVAADKAFHLQIAKICHNSFLYKLYESLFQYLDAIFLVNLKQMGVDLQVNEHKVLYEAVIKKDPDCAVQMVDLLIDEELVSFKKCGLIQ